MRTILFAVSTAAALLTSAPLLTGTASAASLQLAQVDIRVGPPAVRDRGRAPSGRGDRGASPAWSGCGDRGNGRPPSRLRDPLGERDP